MNNPYATVHDRPVADLAVSARAEFISKTYLHLLGALTLFVGLEVLIFLSPLRDAILGAVLGLPWMVLFGGFILVSWFATRAAHTARTLSAQYLALGAFVVAEALIFVPLLHFAANAVPGAISNAAVVSAGGFSALTLVAWVTRKDFSFLRGILVWGGVLAMIAIVVSLFSGFELGNFFSVAMVGLAGAAILYDTSNVLHHYPQDRYVGAALQLFASVAMLFWYVLRIFLSSNND